MSDTASEYDDDYHVHVFADESDTIIATIEYADIHEERGGIWCEVTVYYHLDGREKPIISFERANLQSKTTGAMKQIAVRLELLAPTVNWTEALSTAAAESILQHRTSSSEGAFINVLDPNSDDARDPYLLKPFLTTTGTSIIYGKHGSAKSMFALRATISVITGEPLFGEVPQVTGPVMYIDFEDSPEPHQYRMFAIAEGMGIDPASLNGRLFHERVKGNLSDTKRRLRRVIRDEGIVMAVVDSIGLARGGDVSGSEQTIKLFKMMSQLDLPVLAIDHMSKENNAKAAAGNLKEGEMSPIGSQYTESSARLGWGVVMMPQTTDKKKVINLYNTKHNHTPSQDPMSLDVNMEWNDKALLTNVYFEKRTEFAKATLIENPWESALGKMVSYHFTQQREDGRSIPMSYSDMAKGTGLPYGTVSTYMGTRYKEYWMKLDGTKSYVLSNDGMELAINYGAVLKEPE